jgi:hypothetical protein
MHIIYLSLSAEGVIPSKAISSEYFLILTKTGMYQQM